MYVDWINFFSLALGKLIISWPGNPSQSTYVIFASIQWPATPVSIQEGHDITALYIINDCN